MSPLVSTWVIFDIILKKLQAADKKDTWYDSLHHQTAKIIPSYSLGGANVHSI